MDFPEIKDFPSSDTFWGEVVWSRYNLTRYMGPLPNPCHKSVSFKRTWKSHITFERAYDLDDAEKRVSTAGNGNIITHV